MHNRTWSDGEADAFFPHKLSLSIPNQTPLTFSFTFDYCMCCRHLGLAVGADHGFIASIGLRAPQGLVFSVRLFAERLFN